MPVTHRPLRHYLLLFITAGFLSAAGCDEDGGSMVVVPPGGGDTTVVTPMGYRQYGMPMATVPATEEIVMYEVNLRAFPNGNLDGVTGRLDHLEALGVNVIWLMPLHPIGAERSVNSPYAVQDYLKVGPEYGTLADLRELTDAAHARGMAVIMDWVANHTAWDHPWIRNKAWYTQDASGNIVAPAGTNWTDVADLNFDNAEMRAAMIDAMKYWILEANVDGYRCDFADGVPVDFWKPALDTLEAIPNRDLILLAEGSKLEQWEAGFDLLFGWDFNTQLRNVFGGRSAAVLFNVHRIEYDGAPAGKHRLRYTTNHDLSAWEATPITWYGGKAGATVASVITTYMGGVPLIYTAQETGRAATLPFFSKTNIDWSANADMQQEYRDFMSFYAGSAAAQRGALTSFSNDDVAAFAKTLGTEQVVVLANVRDREATVELPATLQNKSLTNALTGATVALGTEVRLAPYGYTILR